MNPGAEGLIHCWPQVWCGLSALACLSWIFLGRLPQAGMCRAVGADLAIGEICAQGIQRQLFSHPGILKIAFPIER
jgi:hypothetical protein